MPTRRHATGRTLARNVHPRLRLPAAPLHQHRRASIKPTAGAKPPQDLRSISLQLVQRLRMMAS